MESRMTQLLARVCECVCVFYFILVENRDRNSNKLLKKICGILCVCVSVLICFIYKL